MDLKEYSIRFNMSPITLLKTTPLILDEYFKYLCWYFGTISGESLACTIRFTGVSPEGVTIMHFLLSANDIIVSIEYQDLA